MLSIDSEDKQCIIDIFPCAEDRVLHLGLIIYSIIKPSLISSALFMQEGPERLRKTSAKTLYDSCVVFIMLCALCSLLAC